jgi:hypothetical protein
MIGVLLEKGFCVFESRFKLLIVVELLRIYLMLTY